MGLKVEFLLLPLSLFHLINAGSVENEMSRPAPEAKPNKITISLFSRNVPRNFDDCAVPSVTVSQRLNRKICPGELIFEDNFDTNDATKWKHHRGDEGKRSEFQFFRDSRIVYEGGDMRITSTVSISAWNSRKYPADPNCAGSVNNGCRNEGHENWMFQPVLSGGAQTINSFSFMYGRVEVRAKMPAGDWLWPGIRLMPWKNKYGDWPLSGEIAVMLCKGNLDLKYKDQQVGIERASTFIHWGLDNSTNNRFAVWHKNRAPGDGYHKDFHLYQMEWTPTSITIMIDNEVVGMVEPPEEGFWKLGDFASNDLKYIWTKGNNPRMAPFDQEFYLDLSLRVGGSSGFFPDVPSKPWSNLDTHKQAIFKFLNSIDDWGESWGGKPIGGIIKSSPGMYVDYVRVWAL